jgi:transcriptional regulator with XRE-family HTH domain
MENLTGAQEPEAPFGQLLRRQRMAADMTQEALALRAGMSVDAISQLEHGQRPFPRRSTVALLADAMELSPDERGRLVAAQRRLTSRIERPPAAAGDPDAGDSTGPPAGSRVPARRSPLFVGRGAELECLAASLTVAGPGPATVAVTGMGGAGKTQLAVELVHRCGRRFSGGIFWLDLTDPEAVPAQIAGCGGPGFMDLRPDFAELPLEHRLALVFRAWQCDQPRLLVFDGCEDEALLARWRPGSGGCRVLVTSRRATWDAALGVETLPLGGLARAESLELLGRLRTGGLDAGDAVLDAIAGELGDLPLALHLAGSFLNRYRDEVSPADYLAQIRGPEPLEHPSLAGQGLLDPAAPGGRLPGVAQALAASWARLDPDDRVDRTALALMQRAARLGSGGSVTRDGLALDPGETDTLDERLVRADALRRLLALGLLDRCGAGLRLHPLVARSVQSPAVRRRAPARSTPAAPAAPSASATTQATSAASNGRGPVTSTRASGR